MRRRDGFTPEALFFDTLANFSQKKVKLVFVHSEISFESPIVDKDKAPGSVGEILRISFGLEGWDEADLVRFFFFFTDKSSSKATVRDLQG